MARRKNTKIIDPRWFMSEKAEVIQESLEEQDNSIAKLRQFSPEELKRATAAFAQWNKKYPYFSTSQRASGDDTLVDANTVGYDEVSNIKKDLYTALKNAGFEGQDFRNVFEDSAFYKWLEDNQNDIAQAAGAGWLNTWIPLFHVMHYWPETIDLLTARALQNDRRAAKNAAQIKKNQADAQKALKDADAAIAADKEQKNSEANRAIQRLAIGTKYGSDSSKTGYRSRDGGLAISRPTSLEESKQGMKPIFENWRKHVNETTHRDEIDEVFSGGDYSDADSTARAMGRSDSQASTSSGVRVPEKYQALADKLIEQRRDPRKVEQAINACSEESLQGEAGAFVKCMYRKDVSSIYAMQDLGMIPQQVGRE